MARPRPLPRVDGKGIIDMHVHVGPEFIMRRYSAASLANEARREGIGVVMKNHFQPTTAWVSMVRQQDDEVPLIGAVALNLGCGGIDYHGIRSALSGWKTVTTDPDPDSARFVVWMPTVCAESHLDLYGRKDMDLLWGVDDKYTATISPGDGLSVFDGVGDLNAGLDRALNLIVQRDLVLASGHLTGGETKRLIARAHEMGVRRMVLTYPLWQATEFTPDEAREPYVEYGAYTELCFTNLAMHGIDDFSIDDYMEVIKAVGPDGVILSSDCGQTFTPTVADCAREFHALLRQAGVSDDDLELMSVINPNRVLFEGTLAATHSPATSSTMDS